MARRALISVTDKTGVVEFGQQLAELGFSILSTGGTFRVLQEGGVPAVEVSAYTGFPEMMDGRVKTLHPKVHGGLLARRGHHEDEEAMDVHGIDPIDLVAVNLYRFRETMSRPGVQRDEIVESIDIGGPSMLRSAAKNHRSVAVVVDPRDYDKVIAALRGNRGKLPEELGRRLAGKAYAHTAAYDMAISGWLDEERAAVEGEPEFGCQYGVVGKKLADLRYGENPHQRAAVFTDQAAGQGPNLAAAEQLSGKELSYNNLLDTDAALGLALEFDEPAFVVVKHNNPCGAAIAETPQRAFEAALDGDPISAYGGIVATNRPLDEATAKTMVERGTFFEVVVAPEVAPAAVTALQQASWGKSVRILSLGGLPDPAAARPTLRMISGGFLVQDNDVKGLAEGVRKPATKRVPTDAELRTLDFAWVCCKHVKSNAILLAKAESDGVARIVGVGAGQMSRVDSARIACEKAGAHAQGAVLASDAFFPFADGLQVAIDAGVKAAIQPGGSKRDGEVVEAADAAGLAMVMTGVRHFRH